jgi:hypothetical protein
VDVTAAIAQLEGAMAHQVALAGGDPAVETAAESLLAALGPAVRQLAMELAEQAAAEVAAQLSDHEVEVSLRQGEPVLRVRAQDLDTVNVDVGGGDARVTLRLPESLKRLVEEEADEIGESLNAWIVKTVASRTRADRDPGRGRSVSGEFDT